MADDYEDAKVDEEQAVSDNDANTRDIVENENRDSRDDYSEMRSLFEKVNARLDFIEGSIKNLKDAQSVTIDNGAIIRDDSEPEVEEDYVDTRSIAELDLSV